MIRRTRFRVLRSRVLAVCAALLGAAAVTGGLTVAPVSADVLSTIQLQDLQTRLCLDSNYSNPSDPAVGAVYTDPCNGGAYQDWYFGGQGPASTLQDGQTGMCLDSNSSNPQYPATGAVYTDACNWNNTYQNWHIS